MKIPFHDTDNAEIQQFVKSEYLDGIEYIRPHLEDAIEEHILPILGQEQYVNLAQRHHNKLIEEDSSEDFLLRHVQKTTVLFAYFQAIPEMMVQASTLLVAPQEGNFKPIAQWQKKDLQNTYRTKAHKALDRLLAFLDENADAFPKFKESKAYKTVNQFFILNAKEFNRYRYINDSHLVFKKLAPSMRYVENHILKPLLGDNLFDSVKMQFIDNQVDEYNKPLIPLLKEALAWLTFQDGMSDILTEIGYDGIIQLSEEGRTPIKTDLAEILAQDSHSKAHQMVFRIKQFLQDNVRDYPLFEGTTHYVEDSHLPYQPRSNDKVIGFF